MQHSRIRIHFSSTAEDTRESGSTVGGIVAGVVTSLLVIIAATLGITALIWLLRRCTRMHWECLNHHACVLCRKESTIKGLFPTGHFKVAHKHGASPHAQDISLDQLSSEPRLCVCQLRILVTLSSVLNSWRESGRTRAIH